jgi:hypothetical protein
MIEKNRCLGTMIAVVAFALPMEVTHRIFAQSIEWQRAAGDPGDWHDMTNWSYSQPDISPEDFWEFTIDGGGIGEIREGVIHGASGAVGRTSNATLRQSGGTLELFNDVYPALTLGSEPGSTGVFQLEGGVAQVHDIAVGYFGRGELQISNGFLDFERKLSVGDSTDSHGFVVQTGGHVGRVETNLRNDIAIGPNGFGEGRYELSGTGRLHTTNMVVDRGVFVQHGGQVSVVEGLAIRGGFRGAFAEYQLDSETSRLDSGTISVAGLEDGPIPRFFHNDGSVGTLSMRVENGEYHFQAGQLTAKSLVVGINGLFIQQGGTTTADSINVYGTSTVNNKTSTGRFDLHEGTVFTDRLSIRAESSAVFQQDGGRLFVNTLELQGYQPGGGLATFSMGGGRAIVNDSLIVATEQETAAELDFQNRAVLLQTGIGSHVLLGPGASIRNGASAGLLIGGDSLLGLAEGMDVAGVLGTLIHHDVVTYVPGRLVTMRTGQRAQIGSDNQWQAGVITDGFAYDSPVRGNTLIQGELVVLPNGNVRLDDRRSRVIINGYMDAGVFGGTAELRQLTVKGTDGPSRFVVDGEGKLAVTDVLQVVEDQDFDVISGQLTATRLQIGQGGQYSQSGGLATVKLLQLTATGSPPSGRGRALLSGGNLTADEIQVSSSGRFTQSGGTVIVDRLAAESYRMSGGVLTVRSLLSNQFGESNIDLMEADVTVQIEGGILDIGARNPFVRSSNATLKLDETSLALVPAGLDLATQFRNFHSAGIVHDVSNPLLIPADREIHGSGELAYRLPAVQVHGKLLGDAAAGGLTLAKFQIYPGAEVDLAGGTAWSHAGNDASALTGGVLRAENLIIDPDAVFAQTGGEATFQTVTNRTRSSYLLTGGSLTIQDVWSTGELDLGESSAVLVVDQRATLNLDQLQIVNAQSATLMAEKDSLIITNTDHLPANLFGTFKSEGLVHVIGQALDVSTDRLLTGDVRIAGGLINAGTVGPGRSIGQLDVTAGDFVQTSTGRLDLEITNHGNDSTVNGTVADFLSVEGIARLGGTLDLRLQDSFIPAVGDRYTLLTAAQVSGEFDIVAYPEIIAGLKWTLEYQTDRVVLAVAARLPLDEKPLGDFNEDGVLDVADIDALTAQINADQYRPMFDVNGDAFLDLEDRRLWVEEQKRALYGDADLDGAFISADLVAVFAAGEYEDDRFANSTWATGDWDGDLEFGTGDLVNAFQAGAYEQTQATTSAVPEPTGLFTAVLAIATCLSFRSVLARRRSLPSGMPLRLFS